MELRKNSDSFLDIVVRKTTISINPNTKSPSARVLVWNQPGRALSDLTFSADQLFVDKPGEYEVGDVTISAWTPSPGKTDEASNGAGLYTSVQTLEYAVLVVPELDATPEKVVERFGFTNVICAPYEAHTAQSIKMLTQLLKDFADATSLVLVSTTTIDPKPLEEISSVVHPPVGTIKLKDLATTPGDATAIYCLVN